MRRIQQLDNQLANQIAAGEVVERPASVVKELIENSIDADASRIEIDIERGGARLIRIIDDGLGIDKDDLPLALSRHATSKISNFDDLCAVKSLGFRGEALASIASVSKLLLRSRERGDEQGWQAEAEGRDMSVQVLPASSPEGTCIEVRDLFFNTPARRKFLRTEKTEFTHIEDVVRREALATPSVAFVLKHNGKTVKRYPATQVERMDEKLKVACGKTFFESSLKFNGTLDQLKISGWLGAPSYHRSESDCQFIFVNGRPVKDRLLSHAIRQSYAGLIPQGRFASYVVYIECPADEVDVNVHPTKHEVRFRNPRQIHDFLVKLIEQCLTQGAMAVESKNGHDAPDLSFNYSDKSADDEVAPWSGQSIGRKASDRGRLSKGQIAEQQYVYQALAQPLTEHAQASAKTDTQTKAMWKGRYWLKPEADTLWIVDCWQWCLSELDNNWTLPVMHNKPLLLPQMVTVAEPQAFEEADVFDSFQALGIDLTPAGPKSLMLRKLPSLDLPLNHEHWLQALKQLLGQPLKVREPRAIKNQLLTLLAGLSSHSPEQQSSLFDWAVRQSHSQPWQSFACAFNETELLQFIERSTHVFADPVHS